MGLFSKLKANFKHGGVKVTVNGPPVANVGDLQYAVDVTINATDSAQYVKSVTVSIIAKTNQPTNFNDPNRTNTTNQQEMTMYQVSDNTPFTLQPGETKSLRVALPLTAQPQMPGGVLGNVLSALGNNGQFTSRTYQLQAKADVDGIALDPSAHQAIQLVQ